MSTGAGLLGRARRRLPGPMVADIANGRVGPGFDVLHVALERPVQPGMLSSACLAFLRSVRPRAKPGC